VINPTKKQFPFLHETFTALLAKLHSLVSLSLSFGMRRGVGVISTTPSSNLATYSSVGEQLRRADTFVHGRHDLICQSSNAKIMERRGHQAVCCSSATGSSPPCSNVSGSSSEADCPTSATDSVISSASASTAELSAATASDSWGFLAQ
jgi:hypothetical protein